MQLETASLNRCPAALTPLRTRQYHSFAAPLRLLTNSLRLRLSPTWPNLASSRWSWTTSCRPWMSTLPNLVMFVQVGGATRAAKHAKPHHLRSLHATPGIWCMSIKHNTGPPDPNSSGVLNPDLHDGVLRAVLLAVVTPPQPSRFPMFYFLFISHYLYLLVVSSLRGHKNRFRKEHRFRGARREGASLAFRVH